MKVIHWEYIPELENAPLKHECNMTAGARINSVTKKPTGMTIKWRFLSSYNNIPYTHLVCEDAFTFLTIPITNEKLKRFITYSYESFEKVLFEHLDAEGLLRPKFEFDYPSEQIEALAAEINNQN